MTTASYADSSIAYLKVTACSVGDKVQLILQAAHIPQVIKCSAEAALTVRPGVTLPQSQVRIEKQTFPPLAPSRSWHELLHHWRADTHSSSQKAWQGFTQWWRMTFAAGRGSNNWIGFVEM